MKNNVAFVLAFLLCQSLTRADIIITEVNANGSAASYAADWFELTNTGTTAVDIAGWRMDDNSNSFAASVAFRGVTSIAAGQSVVFFEGNATGTTDATIQANFIAAWFGGNAPSGSVFVAYGGATVGLSGTNGDAVNIFDAAGTLQSNVSFGAATAGRTFDNSVLLLNNSSISALSTAGVNGAFSSGTEIGSPGTITAVPEPSSIAMLALASGIGFTVRKRNKIRGKQDAISC